MARRYDTHTPAQVTERLQNGYLRCSGAIARAGCVQLYERHDGTTSRELRLVEDVFAQAALESFEALPLTHRHPPALLDASNTRAHQIGTVTRIRRKDDLVEADVLLTDAEAIAAVDAGERQLSCGYECDIEAQAGTTCGIAGIPDGTPYDAIQRNIRGNHVAIVAAGRAGARASLRLDSDSAVCVVGMTGSESNTNTENNSSRGQPTMANIRIDGVDYDVSDQAHQAFTRTLQKHEAELKKTKDDLTRAEARADQATDEVKKLQARLDALQDPAAQQQAIKARIALEKDAAEILRTYKADAASIDGLSDIEIKRKAILAATPDAAKLLDDKGDIYIEARYDQLLELHRRAPRSDSALSALGTNGSGQSTQSNQLTNTTTQSHMDSSQVRAAMLKSQYERGRLAIGKES